MVDESEHSSAPDIITIRARTADLRGEIRKRTYKSWHDTNLGAILATLAKRNKLTYKVNAKLGATQVQHIDPTNESDMHFITPLARKYDAVATVKKNTCSLQQSTAPRPARARVCPTHRDHPHRWRSAPLGQQHPRCL